MKYNFIERLKICPQLLTCLHCTYRDNKGDVRTCKKCFKVKPDRTHHCSRCDRCVSNHTCNRDLHSCALRSPMIDPLHILKMDHHCPFLANCVGFSNYKFFVLLLVWTIFLAVVMLACGGYHVFHTVTQTEPYQLGILSAILPS